MTQENRRRKCIENSQEMYYKWPVNTDRCSGSVKSAASKDHILWLDDHPPLPLRTRHILFSEMKLGTEDENMSTDNEKLHSVEL